MTSKKSKKAVSATIPCDDCGAPIAYYDGKTLCDKCYDARVKAEV